ncbi:hypothetical protein Nmel_017019 [Mimus melanotis]
MHPLLTAGVKSHCQCSSCLFPELLKIFVLQELCEAGRNPPPSTAVKALMLHHSPADPLLLWHKKTLTKTWLFHKKPTNYRLCVLCSVSSLPGWCLQSQIPRSCGLLVLEHLLDLLLGGWMWKGDVHKLTRTGGDTGRKDNCDGRV